MPSASNMKIEKQINSDSGLSEFTGTLSPLRQAITVIEHKIRNLEKRKAKLESYRDLQSSGKELNTDQKVAVAKYEEVLQTLEFARELCKQFIGIAVSSEKDAKKVARKECAAKSQAELAKIREVLLVQDALNQMGQDNVREDFLFGRNGAIALSETDLKLLDDIYPVVTPKHESGDPTAFTNQVQAAAEHLLAVVDGKQKEAFGATYSQIKEVIGKIHESGYLDQATATSDEEPIEIIETNSCNDIIPEAIPIQDESLHSFETVNLEPSIPLAPMQVEPAIEAIPTEQQVFFQQQSHPRPITEMLGGGSFFFLQDSELDTPDTLPTQTFTNTSYVQAPPPPIPLPPNFQPYQQPGNLVVTPQDNGVEEPPIPQSQAPPHTDVATSKHRGQVRPTANNQQAYYNNNNSNNNYNNRPRPNRNNQNRSGSRHQ